MHVLRELRYHPAVASVVTVLLGVMAGQRHVTDLSWRLFACVCGNITEHGNRTDRGSGRSDWSGGNDCQSPNPIKSGTTPLLGIMNAVSDI